MSGEEQGIASLQEWESMTLACAVVDGVELTKGSRVRLHPRPGGDILDLALAGRAARVAAIEQDYEGNVQVAVTVEEDPGSDLGEERQPGHLFFFSPGEVEPLDGDAGTRP